MKTGTILCMFSGGIDSSGVLHQLFTNPKYKDDPLIIQHIVLQNRENRAQAEMASVKKIIEYYTQSCPERKYTYTESMFSTMGFAPLASNRFPFDMDVCAFMAGNICVARKDIRQVAMGRTKTDVGSGGDNFQKRMERAQAVFRALYVLEPELTPEYIFPVIDMSKNEIWDDLPEAVKAASWYCRHPQYEQDGSAVPCKKCITCKEVAEFIGHA